MSALREVHSHDSTRQSLTGDVRDVMVCACPPGSEPELASTYKPTGVVSTLDDLPVYTGM
eukprot:scaffold3319_cov427-Prasinococcus_capsulatus_cf.AAC.24